MAGRGGTRSTTWKKGQQPTKKKGALARKTKIKQALGLEGWEGLKDFVDKNGSTKLLTEIVKLKGKDYVTAFHSIAEFVKPKLSRTEMKAKVDLPIPFDLSKLSQEELDQFIELANKSAV